MTRLLAPHWPHTRLLCSPARSSVPAHDPGTDLQTRGSENRSRSGTSGPPGRRTSAARGDGPDQTCGTLLSGFFFSSDLFPEPSEPVQMLTEVEWCGSSGLEPGWPLITLLVLSFLCGVIWVVPGYLMDRFWYWWNSLSFGSGWIWTRNSSLASGLMNKSLVSEGLCGAVTQQNSFRTCFQSWFGWFGVTSP